MAYLLNQLRVDFFVGDFSIHYIEGSHDYSFSLDAETSMSQGGFLPSFELHARTGAQGDRGILLSKCSPSTFPEIVN